MIKKFLGTTLITAAILVASTTQTFAAEGWQVLWSGTYNFDATPPSTKHTPVKTVLDGGNVGLSVGDHSAFGSHGGRLDYIRVVAYEDDGTAVGADDYIGSQMYYPNEMGAKTFSFSTSGFADGDNGKAEVYFSLTASYDSTDIYLQMLD